MSNLLFQEENGRYDFKSSPLLLIVRENVLLSCLPSLFHASSLFFQRSLTCLGSVLTLRPIPELLEAPLRDVSITAAKESQEPSSTSLSSGSSSDYDEADAWDFFQQASQEDEDDLEDEDEYDPYAHVSKTPTIIKRDEEDVLIGEDRVHSGPLVIPMNTPSPEPIS